MSVIVFLGGSLLVLVGGAVVFEVANHRGHHGGWWGLLAIALSTVAIWGAWKLVWRDAGDATDLGIGGGVLWLIIAPVAAHIAVGLLVSRIPAGSITTNETAWSLELLNQGGRGECVLRLEPDALVIEPITGETRRIGFEQIEELRPDGECLRVVYARGDGSERLRFMPPADEHRTRERRVRFAIAIANRINQRESSP